MRRRALIIAVSDYDKLGPLSFCKSDGVSVDSVLKWGGYEIPDYNKLTGHVESKIMKYTAYDFFVDHSTNEDDILVFYFSGHAVRDVTGKIYLAPSEIDPASPYKNGFSFADLTDMAKMSLASKIVIILDCCYSGAAEISKHLDGEGICLLAASQQYQEASVLSEKNHSVYTYYLVQGLKGKNPEAFDHSGNITVDTLSSYIYKKIKSLPQEKRPIQSPLRKIESAGDIILIDKDRFSKLKESKLSFVKESEPEHDVLPTIPLEEIETRLSPHVILTKVEQTFRSDFISVLSEVLAPHGLDVKDEIRMTVLGEPVRSPDLLILERGRYKEIDDILHIYLGGLKAIIETKHPKKFATVGFMKLIEYCKLVSPEIGFVTNFKELIEYRVDERGPVVSSKTLGARPDNITFRKISAHILHEIRNPRPKPVEMSDENLISILQNCLADIRSFFIGDVTNLANTLGIFRISYDKDLFKPEEQHKPDLQDLIRKAASFVILNQIIFYTALERRTSLVEQIENLSSLNELQEKFDHVSQIIDYKAVFGARVVSFLPEKALEIINALIFNLETLNFYDVKREILGKIFHNLIPKDIRKRIAAYYTSNTACELLARLAINRGDDEVLDPSCGSGGFLIAAYKVKNELLGSKRAHKNLIQSLYGFDVSTFASHLSVINLTLQDLRNATNEVYVTVDDAFNQHASKTIELLESSPADSQVATVEGIISKKKVLPEFDTVLMNPPFTRIERLEKSYKEYLIGATGIFREYLRYFKGQSGLHCFFLVHIKHFLRDGGLFGSVLPAATFSTEYGTTLKPFILENYRILYFFAYEKQATFSVDCDFKEVLLVATKGLKEARSNWKAKVIVLKKELELNKIESFANQFQLIDHDVDSDSYSVRIVPKQEFKNEWNWMTFTRPLFLKQLVKKLRTSEKISNQEDIIQFHEGYHAEATYFFRLPNKFWNIVENGDIFATISNRVTGIQLNIPTRYLTPVLDAPDAQRTMATTMNSYMLNIPESEPASSISPEVGKYIEWGSTIKPSKESKFIPEFSKILKYTKSGKRWYTYGNHTLYRKDPVNGGKVMIGSRVAIVNKFRTKTRQCIALYSARQLVGSHSYFFATSKTSRSLHELAGDRAMNKVNNELILAAWFSSTIFLALYILYRREVSGDFGQIRIEDMRYFPCMDLRLLSKLSRKSIASEFKALMKEKLPTLYEQLKTGRLRKLDETILKAIGVKESGNLLDGLYAELVQELDRTDIEEDDTIAAEEDESEMAGTARK